MEKERGVKNKKKSSGFAQNKEKKTSFGGRFWRIIREGRGEDMYGNGK